MRLDSGFIKHKLESGVNSLVQRLLQSWIHASVVLQPEQGGNMNASMKLLATAVMVSCLGVAPVTAKNPDNQGNGQGNSKNSNAKGKHDKQQMHYAGIDRKQAKKYARQYQFYGYKPLPPGIRKNLARGKPIPPGLAYNRLPPAYVATLPYYQGYEWRGYGADLVLVSIVSGVIADVLMDALD
jgi:Ni/Co efflux regulator RcnB